VRVRGVVRDKYEREALGSFSIIEDRDENGNRVPDSYEERYGLKEDSGDIDKDKLSTYFEYIRGTSPLNSDTDGGGESDYSEALHGRNPLSPLDDLIEAPDFIRTQPGNGMVTVTHDVKPSYTGVRLLVSESLDGPWKQLDGNLSGQYVHSAENGIPLYFCLQGVNTKDQTESRILVSQAVVPSFDPIPPEAEFVILTPPDADNRVRLRFMPPQHGEEYFDDIAFVRLSNTPFKDAAARARATWQPFAPEMEWQIDPSLANENGNVQIYAQYQDENGNVSTKTETGITQLTVPTAVQLNKVAVRVDYHSGLLVLAIMGLFTGSFVLYRRNA
jgi:hypothetical protein